MEATGAELEVPHHCIKCDYDMQGTTSGNCPECGALFDPAAALELTKQSRRIPRWLGWTLFAPSASFIVLIPAIAWLTGPNHNNPTLNIAILLLNAGIAMWLAIRAAPILVRNRSRKRPGEARTFGYFVLVSGVTMVLFAVQLATAWVGCVIGFLIAILLSLVSLGI